MKNSELVRFFPSGNTTAPGAFTYIAKHYSSYPSFSANPVFVNNYTWSPRNQYFNRHGSVQFDTNDPPYLIIDVANFKISPSSYSITLSEGLTPPTEWTVLGSNTGNFENDSEWTQLSHYSHNINVCENGTQEPNICKEEVSYEFKINLKDTSQSFQYFQLKYLRTRVQDYNVNAKFYFRLSRFEVFGVLGGHIDCVSCKYALRSFKLSLFYFMFLISK